MLQLDAFANLSKDLGEIVTVKRKILRIICSDVEVGF